jgi:hypothetical protein
VIRKFFLAGFCKDLRFTLVMAQPVKGGKSHMSTATQVPANGTGALPKGAKAIKVTYSDNPTNAAAATMELATVSPQQVNKNEFPTVFFHTEPPGKVRVVFLSPEGNETDVVADSEEYKLVKGGFYHFNCYFTSAEGKEDNEPVGGTLDVIPHKP